MQAAWGYVAAECLGKVTSVEMYLKVHALACQHFTDTSGTHMGAKHIGTFRGMDDMQLWTHGFGQNAASHAAVEEGRLFEINGRRVVEVLIKETGAKLRAQGYENVSFGTLAMSEADVRAGVEWILQAYYQEIAAAPCSGTDPASVEGREARVRVNARMFHRLDYLHPTQDGSGRVHILLLNKHLTECGLHPVIMHDPNFPIGASEDELTEAVCKGLTNWKEQSASVVSRK
jgi:hypothetical protein